VRSVLRVRGGAVKRGGRPVLSGVDLDVFAGEIVGLVGASGSGKSSLALAIVEAIPWDAGEVMVVSPVGFVFQDPVGTMHPMRSIGSQLKELLADPRESDNRLREVGLSPELSSRYPHQLSGGEAQRAGIAMALASDPVLLLADEPTTGLDPASRWRVLDLFARLAHERGLALLMISHDVSAVRSICGRCYQLGPMDWEGRSGRPSERGDLVLRVRNLEVELGGREILRGVDLSVASGEIVVVEGPSGAGKTTLARAVQGHLEFRGTVLVDGVRRTTDRASRRKVQRVPQNPIGALDPRRRVRTAVQDALEDPSAWPEWFTRVGLDPELGDRFPRQLSGGQCQRVCIARAVAASPRVLVCDEPLTALDFQMRDHIVHLVTELQQERGFAVLWITHDPSHISDVAHRRLRLENGVLRELRPNDPGDAQSFHRMSDAIDITPLGNQVRTFYPNAKTQA